LTTINSTELAELLADTPAKLSAWKDQAAQLSLLLVPARIEGTVSVELYATIERTCSAIYEEIAVCSAAVGRLAETNAAAAAELAPVDDALRLALLEFTELAAELYAIRSGVADNTLAIGH
jgi:hypothetical protein